MNERTTRAYDVVRRYWKWAAAAGLVQLPILDIAAVTAIQLKMIGDLARVYDVPFSHDRAKSIVGALLGSVTAPLAATATVTVLSPIFHAVPFVAPVVGIAARPTFNAAATYALGRVFIQHFESGGTLLDMDPEALREHYRHEFQAARG